MTSKLRAMLVSVGVFVLGGVGFYVYTPQPAARTMAELRDAGILDGQKFVMVCPERLTPRTRNRIKRMQPDALRPRQSYGHVSRVGVCYGSLYLDGGIGNCFNPSTGEALQVIEERLQRRYSLGDGGWAWLTEEEAVFAGGVLDVRNDGGLFERIADYPRQPEVVVPSLRRDLAGTDEDAGTDDAGEDNAVDDSLQYRQDACEHMTCPQANTAQAGGTFTNPYATPFCGALNRLALQPSPCMLPNCYGLADGGWDDNAGEVGHIPAPNCKGIGPYGEADGGARWRGCNVVPRNFAVGPDCLPVACSVVAGDRPEDWL